VISGQQDQEDIAASAGVAGRGVLITDH